MPEFLRYSELFCSQEYIVSSVQGPELLNKYIGASELAVRETFERLLFVSHSCGSSIFLCRQLCIVERPESEKCCVM
jgi:hypothetical protein